MVDVAIQSSLYTMHGWSIKVLCLQGPDTWGLRYSVPVVARKAFGSRDYLHKLGREREAVEKP